MFIILYEHRLTRRDPVRSSSIFLFVVQVTCGLFQAAAPSIILDFCPPESWPWPKKAHRYVYIIIYMAQRLVVPPPRWWWSLYVYVVRVYTYVVCICANVYSMYMYVSMHMSMYPSPPVDVGGVSGGWRGWEGGGREHEKRDHRYTYMYLL